MKRIVLFLFLLTAAVSFLFGQAAFRPGYIITNDHKRLDCEIANYGSEHSSMDYYYRMSRHDTATHIDIRYVEAFSVEDKHFFRARILTETSPEQITTDTLPPLRWEEKYAFIQQLFDGELASLYFFDDEGVYRFYLGLPDQPLIPLIYKRYIIQLINTESSSIRENNAFRKQLQDKLPCPELADKLNKLHYNERDLTDYLKDYHECKGAQYHLYEQRMKSKLNFKVSLLMNRTTFQIDDLPDHYNFGKEIDVTGGLEMEYLIPHNRYKLSLFAEGNYYYRHSSIYDATLDQTTAIHFQAIEIPLGVNYYFILQEDQKLFLRTGVAPEFHTGENYMMFYNPNNKYDLNTITTFFIGGGYRFKRVSLEYRYYTKQNITQAVYHRSSVFTRMTFMLKFSFWEPGE